MTRQERILLEYSKFQKPIQHSIRNAPEELKEFGIVSVGIGNKKGKFRELLKNEINNKDVERFIDLFTESKAKFRNGYLHLIPDSILLFNNSQILKGNFYEHVILHNKCKIVDGNFNQLVRCYGKSQVLYGVFNKGINIFNECQILNGIFNSNVSICNDSKILNGTFKKDIYLFNKSKILGGIFDKKCVVKVVPFPTVADIWQEDKKTLDLLNRQSVRIEYY